MTGLGTIINSISIIAGGLVGHFTGKLFRVEQQEALNKACGVSVLFIGIAGAIIGYNNSMLVNCCDPELTSIDNKLETLCQHLITTLMGVLGGSEMPKKTVFSGELVKRGTTK